MPARARYRPRVYIVNTEQLGDALTGIVGSTVRAAGVERAARLQLRRSARLSPPPSTRCLSLALVMRRSPSCDLLAEPALRTSREAREPDLSGGALADDVVLLGLHRLKKVISIDAENRRATVEPGVVNLALNRFAAPLGLHYAPDPSSQAACTIGGNVAENAGGPHCLKYGVTLNHVLAITAVLPDGEIMTLGSDTRRARRL